VVLLCFLFLYKGLLSLRLPESACGRNMNVSVGNANNTSEIQPVPTSFIPSGPSLVSQPLDPTSAPKSDPVSTPKDLSPHLLYAVEMLAFAAIGWAWLAVRELMGATPVMDVSVLVSLLVASTLNLLLALIYYTSEQFKLPAQAFFNFVACIVFLYGFGLNESTTNGRTGLCCIVDGVQSSTFSLRLTYKAVYFGGLSLHQPPAAITLAFLSIFLILAAAQAKVCMPDPREWPLPKAALALVSLLSLQQAMFSLSTPVCNDKDLASGVAAIAGLSLFAMVDISWIYKTWYNDEDDRVRIVQLGLEFVLSLLIGMIAAVIAVKLGSGDALLLTLSILLLWQAGEIAALVIEIRGNATAASDESTATKGTAAQFRNPNLPMLLPGVRELRRTQAGKKAW